MCNESILILTISDVIVCIMYIMIHAFISSRLDYCNAILTGLQKKTTERLQLIQNSAARLLTRTKRREHISPVLAALHWLPVTFRID